jgi:DNA-binding transcriptional ArsR family regulator
MRTFLAITTALSDANRVRVVAALQARGELCVCQIVELLGLANSTVSKHLAILSAAGLLVGRKQGRWMYYRVATSTDDDVPPEARSAVDWAVGALRGDAMVAKDLHRLDTILLQSPEDLCKRQATRAERPGVGGACCSSAPEMPAEAKWPKAGHAS